MEDNHPVIASILEFSPQPTSLDEMSSSFAIMGDPQRTEVIQKLRGHLSENTGSPRQQAQLMQWTRQLEAVHSTLRRVGR